MSKSLPYKYLFLCLLLAASCTLNSEKFNQQLKTAESLIAQQPDSALKILQGIEDAEGLLSRQQQADYALLYMQALDKNKLQFKNDSLVAKSLAYYGDGKKNIEKTAKSYFYLGKVYEETGERDKAMQAYLDAEKYVQNVSNPELRGLINHYMGGLYLLQNVNDKAIERYKQANVYFKEAGLLYNELYALQNIGYAYLHLQQYDTSLVYLKQALALARQSNDLPGEASVLIMMGWNRFYQGDFIRAKDYLLQSIAVEKDANNLAQAYNFLSDIYEQIGQSDSSVYSIGRAFEYAAQGGNGYTMANSYLRLYELAKNNNRPYDAYRAIEQFNILKDSLTGDVNRHNVLEIEKKYQQDLLISENQRLALQQRVYAFVAGMSFFSLLSIALFFMLYRSRQQRRWLQLQEKESRERQKLLESEIALVEAHNRALKLNEFVLKRLDVSKEILAMGKAGLDDYEKNHQKIRQIIDKLTFNAKDRQELKDNVNEAFNGFVDKLQHGFPHLTENDIQLCCLIRAGFENDVIISILNITYETLYATRYRLREKLGLVKKNIRLSTFLTSI